MNTQIRQVLFGSLLGDGYISKDMRFSEPHSILQKNYLLWKKNILEKEFIFGKISYERNRAIIRIRTHTNNNLIPLRRLFYSAKRKMLTHDSLRQLTPLGLAVWYCDDGTYGLQSRYCRIFTYCFNYQEHAIIKSYFKEKYGIDCQICTDSRKKLFIHFNGMNTKRFLKLVKKTFEQYNIPKCMWYKLGHLWDGNKKQISLTKEKHREHSNRWYKKPEVKRIKKLYYLANKTEILSRIKNYQQKPEIREKRRKYSKIYYKTHKT